MRVGLLSTLEPSVDDAVTPRGLLRIGGRSIVRHQLDLALSAGCEGIVCLADGLPGEVIALQHAAERAGASFQTAADGRALARLVRPDDELLVLADGLMTTPEALGVVLGHRPGVVVQPVESGVAAGFERIDLNHAGAGVVRLPGRLVEGLAELPGDWNPISALLRIAVQASSRQAVLPAALAADGRWSLVRSDAEAHRLEPQWLRLHTEQIDARGPGRWLAARAVENLGPSLLHAGTRQEILSGSAVAITLIALLLGWFGFYPAGFALLAFAWLVRRATAILDRVNGETHRGVARWAYSAALFDGALDVAFITVSAWEFAGLHRGPTALFEGAFVAAVLFGLLRLGARVFARRKWAHWLDDRLILGITLALASLSGVFDAALMVAVLGVLVLALVAAQGQEPARQDEEPAHDQLTPP